MSSIRSGSSAISVDQALLILIKKYKKDPEASQELKKLYRSGVKNTNDKKLLEKWLSDPGLRSDTSPKHLHAQGKDFLKHGITQVQLAEEKEAISDEVERAKGWNIEPYSLSEYLEGLKVGEHLLPNDAQFTILRHALRDLHLVAEIAAATGEPNIQKVITYPIQRLALFETVAIIETEIRCQSDDELLLCVQDIFRGKIKPLMKNYRELQTKYLSQARQLAVEALETDEATTPYFTEAKQIYENICKRYAEGKYRPKTYIPSIVNEQSGQKILDPQEALKEVALWAISDLIYKEQMLDQVCKLVEPAIKECLNDAATPYRPLSVHRGQKRHSFMLAGAPACGKGTIAALLARYAEEEFGIHWDDIAKINTDVHRQVVSHDRVTGEEKEISAHLNGDEANYITARAYSRMRAKVQKGSAPYLLMDGANPSIDRFELGTEDQGHLHLYVVTAPVSVSIERAYQRGITSGRYVLTQFMLNAHQMVSEQLFPRLAKFSGKNLDFSIFDTHVPPDAPPKLLMEGELQTGEVEIYDKEGMAKFYGKRHIDTRSRNKHHLFKIAKYEMDYSYLDALKDANLFYCEDQEVESVFTFKLPIKSRSR